MIFYIREHLNIKDLLATFSKHGLREKIGIHRLHKHDDIPKEQVKLETKLKTKPGKWIKPTPIDSLDLNNIHGVIFRFVTGEHRLVSYNFGEGPSPVSLNDVVDNHCIDEFVDYIKYNLVDIIALQFLDFLKVGQSNEMHCRSRGGQVRNHGVA